MNYTAANLEDIAKVFEGFARACDSRADQATTQRDRLASRIAALTWRDAAKILRETTLPGACNAN